MRSSVFAAGILFGLVGMPTIAPAQGSPLEPGTRVRLTLPCEPTQLPAPKERRSACALEGELVEWRTDTIALATGGASSSYGLNTVKQLEVSRGRRSHWLLGAGIGFVVGAGSTFLVLHSGGSNSLCNSSANQDALRSGECLGLVGLGGLAGAGIGGFIGGRIQTERWQKVASERLGISLVTQGSRLGLAVAF